MYYAQKNYPDIQGINGVYRINQIGCFITSFCNLEARFKHTVTPPQLNAFLRDHNLYVDVDDGVRDDVSWDTITKYDPNTVVAKVGAGAPSSNNSIVKFVYNGGRSTHFCLVFDHSTGRIIDSWDGQIKSWSVYGNPVQYATYNSKAKQGTDMSKEALTLAEADELYLLAFNRHIDPKGIKATVGKPYMQQAERLRRSSEYKKGRKASK